ncbi:hypothetical protein CH063_11330 [Colletotrichum higginsianum]|uniref:Uncharacterized protein n=2 Tax=Colletotrichum higginsianum TaxID=80884 RepID=H1VKY0_COLHI|nr:hypothetical protein CH63R_03609 [Colletotrichum higginsianum IMI 349063]OBR11313.1 hypothetical protein CH63R_03609 [Colletotrichum higginsianum IMI 349063]TIC99215.1 hypothetical protein CH35J_006483 [Colletotrichum higginsianum]CCF40883.1 hypothetical protein CH063_11330 [Colletotrichum higginsianum]
MRSGSLVLALLGLALTATADDEKIQVGFGLRPCREICYKKASGSGSSRVHECDDLPSCGNLYRYKDYVRGPAATATTAASRVPEPTPAPEPIPTSISVTPSTPATPTAPAQPAFPWRCRGRWPIKRPCRTPASASARPTKACFLTTSIPETITTAETITTPECPMPTTTTTTTNETTTTRRCKPWGFRGYDPRSSCGAPEASSS